ncbi:hypothetical protein J2W97_000224 [Paenibacillus jamilae]|jgi:hypothetical protein|uniref:DUF6097 family protein n=1 Tax=Paenibacillus TaxID=44249 RepID=UPI0005CF1BC9|nr:MULTISPECIES: DUF6097 family protein [Paenibacillus]KAF6615009.1 hypothetical protein HFE00_21980 [Paenibacillus sp. EKM101P]KAF6622270.1 hypothetical protein HFE03_14270 [Paenibacillus sp. EKM102P]KAF6631181.1 hypothetical protein HFE01_12685 [Paenibacillus sp. EKM10P]KAF6650293.1 hypothetical protein HFE02_06290 [Paenibacillus sp. EKM11P]KJD38543.1 hypothetical protein QD46_19000 [Paenibacillus polymyxa]
MNVLGQLGSAIQSSLFIQSELKKAHALIQKHDLPVEQVEDDFHKQIILLEQYASTRIFQQGLARYKVINAMLMILSVIILLAAVIVAVVEYLQPERHLLQVLANAMFDHWVPSITILSVVFVGVIVLAIVRNVYARRLHTRVLDRSWQAIFHHVDKRG